MRYWLKVNIYKVRIGEPIMMFGDIPAAPIILGIVGFIAAISLGSIAWYNSKRPAGWENAERPDYIPKVGEDE
ncbi:MAG: hypothetical protein AAFY30_12630 [Cyanobacteria bacterium J06642_12]